MPKAPQKIYDGSELIRSRFARTTIHCPNPECGLAMAEKLGNDIWFMGGRKGVPTKTPLKMTLASGSTYKLSCPHCGWGHIVNYQEEFIHTDEKFTVTKEGVG